jgi:hypothetical protein
MNERPKTSDNVGALLHFVMDSLLQQLEIADAHGGSNILAKGIGCLEVGRSSELQMLLLLLLR